MKTNNDLISKFLSETFLFNGISEDELIKTVDTLNYCVLSYRASEIVCSPYDHNKRIGFVLEGECAIERRSESEGVVIPLNKLKKGDSFGILSVFSDEDNIPTFIHAVKSTKILFIEGDTLKSLIDKSSMVALNIIEFMGRKISFLNNKISTFSPNNTRQKLANHLYYLSKEQGESFKLNCQKTSKILNIGRASLYRAIDNLAAEEIVEYTNGTIKILNIEKLERISK